MTILVSEGTMELQNMGRARPGMGHMWSDINSNLGVGCRNEDLGGQSRLWVSGIMRSGEI